jgi:hypothetical protein
MVMKHVEFEAADLEEYSDAIHRLATEYGAAEVNDGCHEGNCVTLLIEDLNVYPLSYLQEKKR